MRVILLSGGSGKRLWPLSNNTRSKQFLKLLESPSGEMESMFQRMMRQLNEIGAAESITIATSASQNDIITNQLGTTSADVVTEPDHCDTFPAIAFSSAFLAMEKGCGHDEVVVVVPCDPYTEKGYFDTIIKMQKAVKDGKADLVLMGICPTYAPTKFGYIVPQSANANEDVLAVDRFTEKPDENHAEQLIAEGAFWNGGVFAFKLGYMMGIVEKYVKADTFAELKSRYNELPKISFDYEVAEKAESVAVVPFKGMWKDLGTWNTLTNELSNYAVGNVITDGNTANTNIINELDLPILCIGTNNLVIAASNDGILITEKKRSENIKKYVDVLRQRPMYEERRWGEYKVIDIMEFPDGNKALTKRLHVKAGKCISYQIHCHRDEVWTFIDGEGQLVLNGIEMPIRRGDTIIIKKGMKHTVRATTDLIFIEVQYGDILSEEDIERLDWVWS